MSEIVLDTTIFPLRFSTRLIKLQGTNNIRSLY